MFYGDALVDRVSIETISCICEYLKELNDGSALLRLAEAYPPWAPTAYEHWGRTASRYLVDIRHLLPPSVFGALLDEALSPALLAHPTLQPLILDRLSIFKTATIDVSWRFSPDERARRESALLVAGLESGIGSTIEWLPNLTHLTLFIHPGTAPTRGDASAPAPRRAVNNDSQSARPWERIDLREAARIIAHAPFNLFPARDCWYRSPPH
ncbi:hypothetical protein CALCODRAFT_488766 [Calocera cornea HHB12733]|uniref:Uncharacterized protein n=1 Tax=Calocera cornea HHB12733 TaxID=1353952 RepID=A0A165C799_9BASI|nr:hypothetical protein CALCODRAFT_488766 [Calocera cornea HHB12733]